MQKVSMQDFEKNSYLGESSAYIENLYESYLKDPNSVDAEWRKYFQSLSQNGNDVSHAEIREQFHQMAQRPVCMASTSISEETWAKQTEVDRLIEAYRRFGHLNANLDPLGSKRPVDVRLQLSHYGLTDADLDLEFNTRNLLEKPRASLREIISKLKQIYCGTIGVQYSTISDEAERDWLREYVERRLPNTVFTKETKRSVLHQLIASESLEKYLDTKYVGQKRFSIEGADSMIPMLDELTKYARQQQVKEIVIGMAHRGRINVLLNVMGHSPKELFLEFEGKKEHGLTSGDVKYHRGYSRDVLTDFGPIHLALAFNPSHLEFINPVIMGSVRARQDRQLENGDRRDYAVAVQIHGDAAFSGQGIVMETLSMSQTRAHNIGGSLHIVLNNQVGFTTSEPTDLRSSVYCTDVVKMLDAPIFHVNGDDPEAAVAVMQLALDYRMTFHKDFCIDLVCYRRHGHQEVDEPTTTQPLMYQIIKKHPTTMNIYAQRLIQEKVCSEKDVKKWIEEYRNKLDQGEQIVQTFDEGLSKVYSANWAKYIGQVWTTEVKTTVPKEKLQALGKKISYYPPHFKLQRQVDSIMKMREKMASGEQPADWGFAETLAYATLAMEDYPVRLVGEDSRRGTFYHRHAVLFDQATGEEFMPLRHLSDKQATIQIYDSLLSEAGALGFEFGYSMAEPRALDIWEAQYGDFANGAQVIVDQFISSGWQKWNRLSGVTLLLPHGYEGSGPEHSSARLERYLQLCAQSNMQVVVPTTPAQIFHLLRRQIVRPFRKPLIVMSPKSLLRHKLAVSTLDELADGSFQLLIPEIDDIDPKKVTRVILCSGKVYYDLLAQRRENELNHIAIIRIEQLYPFPYEELRNELIRYVNAKQVVWCQEEPKNQGAWFCTHHRLVESMREDQTLIYTGRDPSAAPAVGYPALHNKQQQALIHAALDIIPNE